MPADLSGMCRSLVHAAEPFERLIFPHIVKKSRTLWYPNVALPCLQEPANCPVLSQMNPFYAFLSISFRRILSSLNIYACFFQAIVFCRDLPLKFFVYFSSSPYVPHHPLISLTEYFTRIINREALRWVLSSFLL